MWLERIKWILANIGWPAAFVFWFQIIVVLYTSTGHISQSALAYFHFLWTIIVCSFFSASFTPPEDCRKSNNQEKSESDDFCEKCNYKKPKRWHHCRRCNRCIHRMDHHCPILQLCIHSGNHKFFLLFLLWPLQLAIFTVFHGYFDLWKMIRSIYTSEHLTNSEQLKGTGVSNAVMVGFAAIYLLKDQIPNLLRNQTLIEEARDTVDYDLGSRSENVKEVMGEWKWAWLPVGLEAKKKKE